MKKYIIIILFSIVYCFSSCGNDEKKQPKKKLYPVNSLKPISETISSNTITITTPIKNKHNITNTKKILFPNKPIDSSAIEKKSIADETNNESNNQLISFVNIRKILSGAEIGKTLTQKDLIHNFAIPKDAVKLVKSVTKTAEDEIDLKWHSTWFIEKISDAKLSDGRMKIKFVANKMYTSGKAIGIKYNRKIYNDLVIIGQSAYIPKVKGYHWEIGK